MELATLAPVKEVGCIRLAKALSRLHDLLPLKERQQSLDKALVDLHRAILQSFVEKGRPLTRSEIETMMGGSAEAARAVALLGSYDLVVRNTLTVKDAITDQLVALDAKGGEIVGAYPLTTEKTPHQISFSGHQLYAMCAVDALAVAPLWGLETRIKSCCHVTGNPVSIHQAGGRILYGDPESVRVGVRWQRVIDCAAHVLCRQMVFLKDDETAMRWQQRDPMTMEVFTLEEAVEFGDAFFTPLLHD
jgi:mercuric reductase